MQSARHLEPQPAGCAYLLRKKAPRAVAGVHHDVRAQQREVVRGRAGCPTTARGAEEEGAPGGAASVAGSRHAGVSSHRQGAAAIHGAGMLARVGVHGAGAGAGAGRDRVGGGGGIRGTALAQRQRPLRFVPPPLPAPLQPYPPMPPSLVTLFPAFTARASSPPPRSSLCDARRLWLSPHPSPRNTTRHDHSTATATATLPTPTCYPHPRPSSPPRSSAMPPQSTPRLVMHSVAGCRFSGVCSVQASGSDALPPRPALLRYSATMPCPASLPYLLTPRLMRSRSDAAYAGRKGTADRRPLLVS